MKSIIKVSNVSKSFLLKPTLFNVLSSKLFPNRPQAVFTALRSISFEAYQGETLGIVGHNGSGKSTLLQVICGVLQATQGQVAVEGRIAALLELGSGFNPEFTGRENIFFNARLLGLSHQETKQRLDTIVDFADIGPFLDRQVKTYSSGMMLRLAFAVAINIEPQILIIDEALSVGDAAFQRKCQSKLKQLKAQGVTLLFVSHAAGQVIELCDRAILLDKGELLMTGTPKEVVHSYHKLLHMSDESEREAFRAQIINGQQQSAVQAVRSTPSAQQSQTHWTSDLIPKSTVWYAKQGAEIINPRIENSQGQVVNVLVAGETYSYCFSVQAERDVFEVGFGMMIKTINGVEIGGATSTKNHEKRIDYLKASYHVDVCFTFKCSLQKGTYFLNCGCSGIIDGQRQFLHRGVDVAMFSVIEDNQDATGIVDMGISLQSKHHAKAH